jgi:hypothetical protein
MMCPTIHPTEPPRHRQAKSEPEWHLNFPRHYEEMVRAAVASQEAALGSAEAGLKWLYGKFEFIKEGHTKSLVAAQVHNLGVVQRIYRRSRCFVDAVI